MLLRIKFVSFMLAVLLLLTGTFANTAFAQGNCGNPDYFVRYGANDSNDGTSPGRAFPTLGHAQDVIEDLDHFVYVDDNGVCKQVFPNGYTVEISGLPVSQSVLIGGLLILAMALIGGALFLRRQPVKSAV